MAYNPLPQPASSVDSLLLALKRAWPDRYPFLLETAATGGSARYSILIAFPGKTLAIAPCGVLTGPGTAETGASFLDALDNWWRSERIAPAPGLPFLGGWFVYLGYELAADWKRCRCHRRIPRFQWHSRPAFRLRSFLTTHATPSSLSRKRAVKTCILIRTLAVENGKLSLCAGAGIVADSVPVRELEETRAKARGMLAALQ